MKYNIIKEVSQLEDVCTAARQQEAVMLDTEFVRIRTFFPQLGLIQLYDGHQVSLIDPLALSDMTAFVQLLQDKSVMKVLHACGEDLEVFQNSFGCLPEPFVDTQIMAAFLGYGLSTGFATLVQDIVDLELDKSESRADWLARPLSDKQLDYAAGDVYYLQPIYDHLKQQIVAQDWWQAVLDEAQLQADKRVAEYDIDNAYQDVKGAWQLNRKQLATLKPLASWRYSEARRRDLALNFVVKEQDLLTIAKLGLVSPKRMEEVATDVRSIQRHGNTLSQIVANSYKIAESEYPELIVPIHDYRGYKHLFKRLKDEVKKVSHTTGLATEFLASKKQINQLISWVWKCDRQTGPLPELMQSWRKDMLGDTLNTMIDHRD
ncbi:ribonuclease D [Vibrio viridaestus]|uniref:Ribonuclease D n=1 Tax=Vibrio viridaestus TaxID=2487322 RepID=A0A3N9TGA2_9VIBR|nr:ribonuclease D [Vibrio viridaestus]RQW63189.1 ribonuclease D [Vibrio viridaestus]